MSRALVSVVVIAALGVAGCGSTRSGPVSGTEVFAGSCAACHSLIGNDSLHRQGGDLLDYRMSRRSMTQFAREMPVRRRLTPAELSAVVTYVQRLEGLAALR